MNNRKRRCRTGCLTCRSRKVKCDEGKPDCERCQTANIECLGYDPRRPAKTQQLPSSDSPQSTLSESFPAAPVDSTNYRSDGLPLVGFPLNPGTSQRPHLRARDVLGYNQYLTRTSTILFPPDHLLFWRDSICEEGFESESIFDLIVGLGTLHRAILLNSQDGSNDRSRGLDTQVIAVQTYIRALQGLAHEFEGLRKKLDILSGALLLFAYFECFIGNIPGTLRHVRAAAFYFNESQSLNRGRDCLSVNAIIGCLQNFTRIYQLVLPFGFPGLVPSCMPTSSSISMPAKRSTDDLLGCILSLSSYDTYIEGLIWSPLQVHSLPKSADKIQKFREVLRSWAAANLEKLPSFDSQNSFLNSGSLSWALIENLPVPPEAHEPTSSPKARLAAAMYNFFTARLTWAVSAERKDTDMELTAYAHFYEALRWSLPFRENLDELKDCTEAWLPCETLTNGLVHMLYLIGTCCPLMSWLQVIIERLSRLGQAGLLNGKLLGRCLNTMYLFEVHTGDDGLPMLTRLPPPSSRVIPFLIPDIDSGGFTTFYAKRDSEMCLRPPACRPVGQARWGNCFQKNPGKSTGIEFFSDTTTLNMSFGEWIETRQTIIDWKEWADTMAEFDMELATRDHIQASRFVFDSDHDATAVI